MYIHVPAHQGFYTCKKNQHWKLSQMLGQKQWFFLCIGFSVVTLAILGFYLNTSHSNTFIYTNTQHKGKIFNNVVHTTLFNSTSVNLSKSISRNQKPSSQKFANNFQNQSVHSSQSSGNQKALKTSAGNNKTALPQFTNKLKENADTKVETAKQAEKANAPVNNLENIKSPSRQKLPDFPASGNKSKVPPTPDPLYTHHGYLSVLDHKKKLNLHCMQCAYVSSSGQVLNSGAGYLIDEADCVFRMNDAPASGYEEDVGTRTTVRVIAHSATPNLRRRHQYLVSEPSLAQFVVGWGPTKPMRTNGTGGAYNILRDIAKMYKRTGFFYLTQEQMTKADVMFETETGRPRMKSGTYLSTGWFTMLLARQACDEIHIYGMVNDDYCQIATNKNVPYHYYDKHGKKECDYYKRQEKGKNSVHRFITEKAIFARWALEQPLMYFHNPFWNP